MRLSTSGSRFALCVLTAVQAWACATAVDSSGSGEALGAMGGDLATTAGASGSATGGSFAAAGSNGSNTGGRSTGGVSAGGSNSAFGGGAGMKGGASGAGGGSSGGSSGANGTAGKGGASGIAGASAGGSVGTGGTSSSGGKSSTGGAVGAGGSVGKGGTGNAGSVGSGGSVGSAGAPGGGTCDAAHSAATIVTGAAYTGKANDCVRLAVNPTWSAVKIEFQAQPGTTNYPIAYSYSSCSASGTASLTKDYTESIMISGANPGCDVFVQFGAGATALKVIYFD